MYYTVSRGPVFYGADTLGMAGQSSTVSVTTRPTTETVHLYYQLTLNSQLQHTLLCGQSHGYYGCGSVMMRHSWHPL